MAKLRSATQSQARVAGAEQIGTHNDAKFSCLPALSAVRHAGNRMPTLE
ncbi:hypothetical protein I553_4903 [Mycobacterium xenopi 4042]|uniref:Uncharacterized protein n=1 Tax=Mycobacterium xenopi 4042 TaxID=1299334 RepID=X8AHL0_MYCXE|nr:hypothetical protein I553_4903 [Mycobacterium xenopi 4042]